MGRDDDEIDLTLLNAVSSADRRKRNIQSDKKELRAIERNARKIQRKKRFRRKLLKVLIVLISFIIIVAGSLFIIAKYVPGGKEFLLSNCGGSALKLLLPQSAYENIFDKDFNKEDIITNDGIDKEKFSGYYTLALFGIDARDSKMDAGVNSDSIIIVSINQDTGKVVLSSVYRDTWLNIPVGSTYDDDSFRKVNSAFCKGGVKDAINTLNTNLDLNISDYVTINFYGLATIIDMLGGIDINISEDEVYYTNKYLDETVNVTGIKSSYIKESGLVHLNGIQATSFCRIRSCSFTDAEGNVYKDDMGRTARQRYVLSCMVEKAKEAGVTKLLDIAKEVFSGDENILRTSIEYDRMMDMIPAFIDYELTEAKGFPFTYFYPDRNLTNGESAIAVGGLSYNVTKLHEFLYDDTEYVPSKRVSHIDKRLKELIGAYEID